MKRGRPLMNGKMRATARDYKRIRRFVGEQIRWARKDRNLSQKELASRIGVQGSAVGNWEQGSRLPDIVCLFRLARVLGLEPSFFDPEWEEEE